MLGAIKQSPNYKWWVFCTIATGTFMSVLGHGSVLIALPVIARHFDASLTTVVWISISEFLTISALLLPMGRLSDIVGRKQVYVVGFTIFLICFGGGRFFGQPDHATGGQGGSRRQVRPCFRPTVKPWSSPYFRAASAARLWGLILA